MKFSIITVCYNSEKTIRRTFESVLAQKFADYEYIVVDGASKDSTLDIIKEYQVQFNGRMRYISEPDKGIYDAMNKGIAMAQGEFLNMLNSDDQLAEDALEIIDRYSIKYPDTDIFNGCEKKIDVNGMEITVLRNPAHYLPYGIEIRHQSAFIRRSLHDRIGLYNGDKYSVSADYEFFLRAYRMGAVITPCDSVISVFSADGTSIHNPMKNAVQINRIRLDHNCISKIKYHLLICRSFYNIKIALKIRQIFYKISGICFKALNIR